MEDDSLAPPLPQRMGAASEPSQKASRKLWRELDFNIFGLGVITDDHYYSYKLPYTIQPLGWCSRLSPKLMLCDSCCVCCDVDGSPSFMDLVDQETGDQVRFKSMTGPNRVQVFRNGMYFGEVGPIGRCCNAQRTCCEDARRRPILELGMQDHEGRLVGRIEREGRGCCLECKVANFCRCQDLTLSCFTCTLVCRPTSLNPVCGLCCPDNCCSDPVCCNNCIRGPAVCCMLDGCGPFIGCPPCIKAPECWCCGCRRDVEMLPTVNTIRLETFAVVRPDRTRNTGIVQFQYRGNYPCSFNENSPATQPGTRPRPRWATVDTASAELSQLSAALVAGRTFKLGRSEPVFRELQPRAEGRSPPFGGWVVSSYKEEMLELVKLLREDCVVDARLHEDPERRRGFRLGDHISGHQVNGWVLTDISYVQEGFSCCGCGCGSTSKGPVYINSPEEASDLVRSALEHQLGDYGTTFSLRFRLPDQEKGICGDGDVINQHQVRLDRSRSHPFNGTDSFKQDLLEEVALACICKRLFRLGQNTPKECILCRCPLYARTLQTSGLQSREKEAIKPPQVVMTTRR